MPQEVLINDAPWMVDGLCRKGDPDLWSSANYQDQKMARLICFGCPVREACLGYALDRREPFGVWGGYTERQRRRIRLGLPVRERGRPTKG